MSSFGEKIKAERERQGFDLDAVAEETKIRKLYLKALEEEDFSILPPRVYATGFVTRYAQFLKMDPEALSSEFQSLAYQGKPPTELVIVHETNKKEEKKAIKEKKESRNFNFPAKNVIAGALFFIIAVWGGNYLINYMGEKGTSQPPSVQEPQANQNQAQNNQNNQNNQAQQVTDKLVLDIEAKENCWLRMQIDGVDQYTGIMIPGEKKTFTAAQSIVMIAGNAGGIDLSLNSQKQAALGERGQVVEKQFDFSSITKE